MLTRRAFLSACVACGCARAESAVRLRSRPAKSVHGKPFATGVNPLGLRHERDALLYMPESAPATAPLLVYLHGATGNEQQGIRRMSPYADEFGFLLLSPASENGTWDAIRSGYGPDVRFIDKALKAVFSRHLVDERKVAICGFSDGASYALGVGISNGDLFRRVMAFSPGFIPDGIDRTGSPEIFISHGTADRILKIDTASRLIVPELKHVGFQVRYEEFEGPHTLPPDIARAAMEWYLR